MRLPILLLTCLCLLISCGDKNVETVDKVPVHQKEGVKSTYSGTEIMVDGKLIKVPFGSRVDIKIEKTKSANSKGAGVKTSSPEVAQTVKTDAPTVSLPGSSASGGGLDFVAQLTSNVSGGQGVFYTIGGILFIVGIVMMAFLPIGRMRGMYFIVGGIGFIATGMLFQTYPWVLLLTFVLVVGAGVWYVIDTKNAVKVKEALKSVVRGIAKADGNGTDLSDVKANINKADKLGIVKDEVSKIKKKENL